MNKHIPCKRCDGRGFINWPFSEGNTGTATSYVCPDCNGSGVSVVPMTNADRIRAMSDEELVEVIIKGRGIEPPCAMCAPEMRTPKKCNGRCTSGIMRWLQQPAKEE